MRECSWSEREVSLAGGEGRGRPEEEIFQAERRPTAVLPLTDEEIYY